MIERKVSIYNYVDKELIFCEIFDFMDAEELKEFIENLYNYMSRIIVTDFKVKEKMQYVNLETFTIKLISKDKVTLMDGRRLLNCEVTIEPYLPEKVPNIY